MADKDAPPLFDQFVVVGVTPALDPAPARRSARGAAARFAVEVRAHYPPGLSLIHI